MVNKNKTEQNWQKRNSSAREIHEMI